jgi:ferrochelatase
MPDLTIIRDYHDHPAYLRALAESVQPQMDASTRLLFSFHGIPRSYGEAGDPYESQCQRTATLLAEALGLNPESWSLAFQSRFGPEEWLTPYTDEELSRYGREHAPHLNVVCPGFAIDCLETLDEIGHEGQAMFQQAGGGEFNYIPALNDGPSHVGALREIILSNIC